MAYFLIFSAVLIVCVTGAFVAVLSRGGAGLRKDGL